ncbi:MAG: cytochrome c nitrite reductase small subunit [Armatimonadota bacterium]|nr:cytochrome c nitrite reductase small subunit [Armatimonadota bacterium]
MRPWSLLGLALTALAGLVVGLGAYTFVYGKGYSYLLDDPAACANCHIMRDNYDAWTVATHRTVTCNECHVPGAAPARYLSKARNGFFHSYAFTFEDVQVIRIRTGNQRVLQANCQGCHEGVVMHVQPPGAEPVKFCFDCHRGVGHGF